MINTANICYDGETVDISGVKLEKHDDFQEMSAMVEGMVRGIPVRIIDDIAISHRLAQTFEEIQTLFKSWNDDFTISPIIAKTRRGFPKTDHVISCYSGGIDSTYTYGKFRRYERKQKFHNFFKFLLGKWGRQLFRRHTDNPWYSLRATLVSNKVK